MVAVSRVDFTTLLHNRGEEDCALSEISPLEICHSKTSVVKTCDTSKMTQRAKSHHISADTPRKSLYRQLAMGVIGKTRSVPRHGLVYIFITIIIRFLRLALTIVVQAPQFSLQVSSLILILLCGVLRSPCALAFWRIYKPYPSPNTSLGGGFYLFIKIHGDLSV